VKPENARLFQNNAKRERCSRSDHLVRCSPGREAPGKSAEGAPRGRRRAGSKSYIEMSAVAEIADGIGTWRAARCGYSCRNVRQVTRLPRSATRGGSSLVLLEHCLVSRSSTQLRFGRARSREARNMLRHLRAHAWLRLGLSLCRRRTAPSRLDLPRTREGAALDS
jgi:hypothetical protein